MKNRIPRLLALGAALLAFAGCATTRQPTSPDTVSVLVNLPPTASLIYSDWIADAFTDSVRSVFRQAGFQRPIENIRYVDDPDNAPYLLTINLMDWRFTPLGDIDCTFTAQLGTPRGTRNLGVYSGTSLRISRNPGPWGLADAFGEAAQGAIADLFRAVVKTELLPARTTPSVQTTLGAKAQV
jgi:hypothetical protein